MLKSISAIKLLLLTLPIITFVFSSTTTYAEIYKWRDNRGVIQYSDKPPASDFTKASRSEIVNSLQKKDVCAPGTTAQKKNSLRTFSANFGLEAAAPSIGSMTTLSSSNNLTQVTTIKPVVSSGSPSTSLPSTSQPSATGSTPKPTAVATAPSTTSASSTASTPAPTTTATAASTTSSNIVKVAQMPAVDINKNIAQALGDDTLRIARRLLADGSPDPRDIAPIGGGSGAFRIDCTPSHMSNDDPIVYPNQPGAAHHHTFFGNTSINYKTNPASIAGIGNSTCRGGIANRSAYWIPSMINTLDNTPMKPYSALWYYKPGYRVAKENIKAPPKGLRMIAGNMKSTSPQVTRFPEFTCQMPKGFVSPPSTKYIPACPQGAVIMSSVVFPQCWDGKNLDSPDHKSHMEYANPTGCPSTHPIAIPVITLNTKYDVTTSSGTKYWRLSSDNYAASGYNAGYSSHADWINGWDENVLAGIVKNCLNRGVDCGNHMLGDGRMIYMGSKIPG